MFPNGVLHDQVPPDDPRNELARSDVYAYVYADPAIGTIAANLRVAERREAARDGRQQKREDDCVDQRRARAASPTIAVPVVAKIPAPIVAPTPSAVRVPFAERAF
jgi:hypothetical protein